MNKICTLIFISITLHTAAQPVSLGSQDFMTASDSAFIQNVQPNTPVDYQSTGAGYIWDFSSLTANSINYRVYDSPFTFTSPFNLLFSILNCSYGVKNESLTSLPIPGITFGAAYDFFRIGNSSLRQVGAGYTINGTPLPFYYTSQDYVYRFPLTYQQADTTDFKFGLPIPTLGYYGQKGTRSNYIDGWGTIITPSGSYPCLRQVSLIEATDTIYIDNFSLGFNTQRPDRIEYKWLSPGKKVPVLQITTQRGFGNNQNVISIQFCDSTKKVDNTSVVSHSLKATLSLGPNPAIDFINLTWNTAPATLQIYTLFSRDGKSILKGTILPGTTFHTIQFPPEIPSGIYLLNISGDSSTEIHPICINR